MNFILSRRAFSCILDLTASSRTTIRENEHLGFAIYYTYQGATHTYWPDYLIKFTSGKMLVLEVKGKDDQQNRTKREFLDEWVRAVNAHGGFGQWSWDVSRNPADVKDILAKHE